MNAVILAGGQGTRLGKLGEGTAKCLLQVGGVSILTRQIRLLQSLGVNRICAVTGHHADAVAQECKKHGVATVHNEGYQTNSMLEGLLCARSHLSGDVLVLYADMLVRLSFLEALIASPQHYSLAASKVDTSIAIPSDGTKIELKGHRVLNIGKSLPNSTVHAEYIGALKLGGDATSTVVSMIDGYVASGEITALPSPSYLLRRLLEQGEELHAVFVDAADFAEIDYPDDLAHAKTLFTRPPL